MDFMNDDEVYSKVSTLMQQLDKNQQLQDLAESNGLDVKNSIRLNNDTKRNVAVAVVSLELARRSNDPKYHTLTQTGLQKRRLKADIINTYKNQANQLINRYYQDKAI